MNKNSNLHQAKRAKNDEFYTQLGDIENECKHYRKHFIGKTILCNCNDEPFSEHSNFADYFSINFEALGLKELICTSFNANGKGKVFRYHGDKDGNRMPDAHEWDITELEGNGGFDTPECVELLNEADIVVTNPPFSLFSAFIALLEKFNKKYLIVGNGNAITYKEVFPLIKENKLWLGYVKGVGGQFHFLAPEDYDGKFNIVKDGKKLAQVNNACWFTNMDHSKCHEPLDLYRKYTPEEYPKYDNYDAINVNRTCDIPMDYEGVSGVPITFLDKYCPEQFEIVKFRKGNDGKDLRVNNKCQYFRVLVKQRKSR